MATVPTLRVREKIPGYDMVYVKEKLDDRILFVPGAFTADALFSHSFPNWGVLSCSKHQARRRRKATTRPDSAVSSGTEVSGTTLTVTFVA